MVANGVVHFRKRHHEEKIEHSLTRYGTTAKVSSKHLIMDGEPPSRFAANDSKTAAEDETRSAKALKLLLEASSEVDATRRRRAVNRALITLSRGS